MEISSRCWCLCASVMMTAFLKELRHQQWPLGGLWKAVLYCSGRWVGYGKPSCTVGKRCTSKIHELHVVHIKLKEVLIDCVGAIFFPLFIIYFDI